MTTSTLKRFLVLYLTPAEVLSEWSQTDPSVKKTTEEKMRAEWQRWMTDHARMVTVTEAGGKTKAVTSAGIVDTKNDIMLYSIVEAENHEIASRAFAQHPHLEIPKSSIQIMEVRALGPM